MAEYKVLEKQEFIKDAFTLVPIRMEDRYKIMGWRNEQMYHLRQNKPLTEKDQDEYFRSVVANLYKQDKPNQLLFSFLKDGELKGYGGLVHINWIDKNAEISFLMNPELEKEEFEFNWITFLSLIEKVAFEELGLHKIYTYAFDLRPRLYIVLEKSGFRLEAELKDHCNFNNDFINVKIHVKLNKKKIIRKVIDSDLFVTYGWANDEDIRQFSFNKQKISLKEHSNWFFSNLDSSEREYYLLEVFGKEAGSIRFDIEDKYFAKINYLLDPNFTGKGLGTYLLKNGLKFLKINRPEIKKVYGYVFQGNLASARIFEKLSFENVSENPAELKFEKLIK